MKGLEISILPKSEVLNDNRDSRLDSQYFRKIALFTDDQISRHAPSELRNVASKVLSFGAYALTNEFEYQEAGVPFLRGTNFHGDFVNFGDVFRVSEEAHKLLHKSEVKPGMVLLSMSGSVGSVSVALDSWQYPINSNQDVAKIVPYNISPFFLAAYLASKHGQIQIERQPVGSVQQHIFLWMIERLKIPRFSEDFERAISRATEYAYVQHETVPQLMADAHALMMKSLGLADWTPPEPLTFGAKASDALAAGRLDAQYFRPLFEEVAQRLRATGGAIALGEILTVNARGRQPLYDDVGLPVVNSKHVRTNRVILDDNRTATESGSPVQIRNGDVLINGTGVGTIGRTAVYLHDEPALPDNHVTVLRTDQIDPVFLSVFLNSPLGQWQIERHIKGSSGQIELYPHDIARIVAWDAPDEVQQSVRNSVLSAFGAERRAKSLLDAAKRAVEIAIEGSEAAALAYLATVEGENLWLSPHTPRIG